MNVLLTVVIYLAVMNFCALFIMGLDKHKAKKREWRIPEATLFAFALFGGSFGATLGMFLFHHKTRHWYFLFGFPLILIVQLAIAYLIYTSPIQFMIL